MDTFDSQVSEYPSLTHSVLTPSGDTRPPPGYDMNSSTKEILVNLQTQVQQEQAKANEVNKDENTKAREKRSKRKRRFSGTLQAYDNMSIEDIIEKYQYLSRRGSTMYSKEVGKAHSLLLMYLAS